MCCAWIWCVQLLQYIASHRQAMIKAYKTWGGQSLSLHHMAVWLIWLSKERKDLDCHIGGRLRGRAVQIHKCVGRFFLSEPRRLGIPGRARPSGTERKSQNRPAMVRFSGALFFVWQCLFLIFFVSLCGVYDVHLYKLVICVPRGLGCAMTPGRWSYHMS